MDFEMQSDLFAELLRCVVEQVNGAGGDMEQRLQSDDKILGVNVAPARGYDRNHDVDQDDEVSVLNRTNAGGAAPRLC